MGNMQTQDLKVTHLCLHLEQQPCVTRSTQRKDTLYFVKLNLYTVSINLPGDPNECRVLAPSALLCVTGLEVHRLLKERSFEKTVKLVCCNYFCGYRKSVGFIISVQKGQCNKSSIIFLKLGFL